MRRWLIRILSVVAVLAFILAGALALICTPQPFFAHHLRHGAYDLWSDRPIPAEAPAVLDEVTRRVARSPLWSADQRFSVFICNDGWRLALFSMRLSSRMGGVADTIFTGNVYLRRSDLALNRLIPPSGWRPAMADRPLSYYMAHEFTHVMEARAFGRAPVLRYPHWLLEGYADYVAKAGRFDYARNLADLRAGASEMDWKASGLYRVYHLETAYYLDRRRMSVRDLFAARPTEAEALAAVQAEPSP